MSEEEGGREGEKKGEKVVSERGREGRRVSEGGREVIKYSQRRNTS